MNERVTLTGKHRHKKAGSHREIKCECGYSAPLKPNERCCGFDIYNRPLIDIVTETDFFCCECGAPKLNVEKGEGDYYAGPSYYCDKCDARFTMG